MTKKASLSAERKFDKQAVRGTAIRSRGKAGALESFSRRVRSTDRAARAARGFLCYPPKKPTRTE